MEAAPGSKITLITGASGGLGSVTVRAFEDAGYEVCRQRRGDRNAKLEWFDVTDPVAAGTAVEQAVDEDGRIDVLINLVGGFRAGPKVTETSDEDLEAMLRINLRSTFVMSRAVVPHMVERGWGRIINIGARPGEQGGAGSAAYGISKAGVHVLTESLAAELKGDGVTVNALVPSIIDTLANREALPDADFTTWVRPEHLAATMLFLCTDEGASITGQRIRVFNRA